MVQEFNNRNVTFIRCLNTGGMVCTTISPFIIQICYRSKNGETLNNVLIK